MLFALKESKIEINYALLLSARTTTMTILSVLEEIESLECLSYIVLFGSVARLEATNKSDIDLLLAWNPMSPTIIGRLIDIMTSRGVVFVDDIKRRSGKLNVQHVPTDDFLHTDGRDGWIRKARKSGMVMWSASGQN